MKDWKGNDIQIGQTVLLVATGSMFEGSSLIVVMIDGEDHEEVYKSEPLPKSYSFEIIEKYLITEPSVAITTNLLAEINKMPVDHADFFIVKQPWHIICIEGISDNRDEYYAEYFKL